MEMEEEFEISQPKFTRVQSEKFSPNVHQGRGSQFLQVPGHKNNKISMFFCEEAEREEDDDDRMIDEFQLSFDKADQDGTFDEDLKSNLSQQESVFLQQARL